MSINALGRHNLLNKKPSIIARFFMCAKPSTLATDILGAQSLIHYEKNSCINRWSTALHRQHLATLFR